MYNTYKPFVLLNNIEILPNENIAAVEHIRRRETHTKISNYYNF